MPKKQKKAKKHKKSAPKAKALFSPIQPLGDRVLIKPLTEEEAAKKLPSGIIIPATIDNEKTDRGRVMAVGPGRIEDGKHIAMNVKVGDKVLFQWGEKIEVNDVEYFVVAENNILAIIN